MNRTIARSGTVIPEESRWDTEETVADDELTGGAPFGIPAPVLHFDLTYEDKNWQETITLRDSIVIGRNVEPGNLKLDSRDLTASRVHCELYLKDRQVMVRNRSEKKGTILNGEKITSGGFGAMNFDATVDLSQMSSGQEEAAVYPGDTLTLGKHTIVIQY